MVGVCYLLQNKKIVKKNSRCLLYNTGYKNGRCL